MRNLFTFSLLVIAMGSVTASDAQEGYAVVKKDTIYGLVKINFDAGSIIVKQGSVNRMFLNDVQSVTFLNNDRETYYTFEVESKTTFFKVIVPGDDPLLEKGGTFYCILDRQPTVIDEKHVYAIFGKKKVKEFTFIRNLSLTNQEGILEVFSHFNEYLNY